MTTPENQAEARERAPERIYIHPADAEWHLNKWPQEASEYVEYVRADLFQQPATSERCVKCGHHKNNQGCRVCASVGQLCECVYPATGAETCDARCQNCEPRCRCLKSKNHIEPHSDWVCVGFDGKPYAGEQTRWCAYQQHAMGQWQPAALPWRFERVCSKCGFVEKSSAENAIEFRPATSPAPVSRRGSAGRYEMILIELVASDSKSEAERLLQQGGRINSLEVARYLAHMLGGSETTREDVVFFRRGPKETREFSARTFCCAVEQNMEWRPAPDTTCTVTTSEAAREAALAISDWLKTGDGEVDGNAINEVAAIISTHLPDAGEVEWLAKLLNEYGGQRCTNVCPLETGCKVAHWCLLARNHTEAHLHSCVIDRLRANAIKEAVEKAKALRDEWQKRVDGAEVDSAVETVLYSRVYGAEKIITALQSLLDKPVTESGVEVEGDRQ